MMHALAFLLLLSFPFSHAALAGTFVGNGGDGVEIEGKLYVRDLVNLNVHQAPYFGSRIDPQLPALPNPNAMSIAYPKELLAKKLTDLNDAYPSMGDYILAAMKFYSWVLVDFPLTPVVDPRDTIELPPGTKVVQIANRLDNTIRIHAESWGRLDDANKVALLIHEAIYSLIKTTKVPNGLFEQSPYTAREITGQLFSAGFFSESPFHISRLLEDNLNIPSDLQATNDVRQTPKWSLSYGILGANRKPISYEMDFNKHVDLASINAFIDQACGQVSKLAKSHDYWITSLLHARPVRLVVDRYSVAGETDRLQADLVIESRSMDDAIEYNFESREKCRVAFASHVDDLISALSW